jgi:hypothetical protein
MDILAVVAEQKIREAMARGEFDNLPGAGKPLVLEDYGCVPEELRMAYKVLKNAGCVPPEVALRKEIVTLQNLLATLEEGEERRVRLRELNFKLLRLNTMRRRPVDLEMLPEYRDKLYERLAG